MSDCTNTVDIFFCSYAFVSYPVVHPVSGGQPLEWLPLATASVLQLCMQFEPPSLSRSYFNQSDSDDEGDRGWEGEEAQRQRIALMYHSEEVARQDEEEEEDPLDAFMAGVEVCLCMFVCVCVCVCVLCVVCLCLCLCLCV